MTTLAEIGEQGLLQRLAEIIKGGVAFDDDCAVLPGEGQRVQLLTADALVEGTHFTQGVEPKALGNKAVAVNVSDIAAMGGQPHYAVTTLAATSETSVEWLEALARGMQEAADRYGLILAGGDTCRTKGPLMLSVALLGSAPHDRLIRRSGAVVGDLLAVTGPLGAVAAGLTSPKLRAHLAEGQFLAEGGATHAMLDISDGLLSDAGQLARASRVGVQLRFEAIPVPPGLEERADAQELGLVGGEDYCLLVAVAPERFDSLAAAFGERFGTQLVAVGQVVEGAGVQVLRGGQPYEPTLRPFSHFGENSS